MNNTDIKYAQSTLSNLIGECKLKDAFDLLHDLISKNGLGELLDEQLSLEQNYSYMLRYTVEGINDPERQKIYRHLRISTYELADRCIDLLRMKYDQTIEYQKKRGFSKLFINDFPSFLLLIEDYHKARQLRELADDPAIRAGSRIEEESHYQKLITLFYHFWFRNTLSETEVDAFRAFVNNPDIPVQEKSLVVSSLLLSLLRYFDEGKFLLLTEFYHHAAEEVSQRALIILLLMISRYDRRLQLYTPVLSRIKLMNDEQMFRVHIEKIILQLIGSKETEKIQRKLEDEIIPEVMKLSPNLRNKLNIETLFSKGPGDEEKNPEWRDLFSESPGLLDKMEELTEMQMKGEDVFMTSFSSLKGFPHFSELANWFAPFYAGHPTLTRFAALDKEDSAYKFMNLIMHSSMLCDSDRYSLFLSMENVPEEYKKMMFQSMGQEFDQLLEMEESDQLITPSKKAEMISGLYIRDLYRFFKIHPFHNDFEPIFGWDFDFHNCITLKPILQEEHTLLRNIADYYFAKNYFHVAADIYKMLIVNISDAELFQKIAFCHQKQGEYTEALEWYLKADLFDQNKLWNYKKIALCYKNLRKPDQALVYYQKAVALEPDNLSNHASIGHCQMELGFYEEALKSYFKVEYLAPGNKKIWRPIGWCSLLSGKKSQAENYFRKLVDDQPNSFDLMNMGHVQWCLGNRKLALEFYRRSISDSANSEELFMEGFYEDLPHLINQGVDPEDVPILLDQLRYSLDK